MFVALCLTMVSDLIPEAEDRILLEETSHEARKVKDCISGMYHSSTGDSVTVTVSLPPGCAIDMGGEGHEGYSLRIVMSDEVVSELYLDNPPIPVMTKTLLVGETSITFTRTDVGVEVTT